MSRPKYALSSVIDKHAEKVIRYDDHIDFSWLIPHVKFLFFSALFIVLPYYMLYHTTLFTVHVPSTAPFIERFIDYFRFFVIWNGALFFVGAHAGAVLSILDTLQKFGILNGGDNK